MAVKSTVSTLGARLRAVHPLADGDGSCSYLYDLERTLIIEVPLEFQGYIGAALESGDIDSALIAWLASEELLTSDRRITWAQGPRPAFPAVTDISLDMSGACNMGCTYCFESDINSRIGRMTEATASATLDFLFRKTNGKSRITLHFGSGEPLLRFDLLQKIVAEAMRRAGESGQQLSLELTTNATLVTHDIACFLRDHPFNVRVSCNGPAHLHDRFRPLAGGKPSYAAVERGLRDPGNESRWPSRVGF